MPVTARTRPMPVTARNRLHQRRRDDVLRPPPNGRCLIDRLPDEVWLDVLSYMDWEELMAIRRTSRRISRLVLSPFLHRSLSVPCVSARYLPLVLWQRILPLVRHLYVTDAPSKAFTWRSPARPAPVLMNAALELLQSVQPDRLCTLSLRCFAHSSRWDEIGDEIARIGGVLERLDLQGARLDGTMWGEWMKSVGVRGNGLRELDLSVSSITTLPANLPWDNLEVLSLRSCYLLQSYDLRRFLANIPQNLRSLNLSYLSQLSLDDLYGLRVTAADGHEGLRRTALTTVHLVGIDHFTKSDVRDLQRHWAEQRAACSDAASGPDANSTLEARHSSVSRWPCRFDFSSDLSTSPAFSASGSSPPSSPSVPFTPRTPESESSEVMPTTPESSASLYRSRRQPSPDLSGTWELGALGEAMYTPPKRRRVVLPFDDYPSFKPQAMSRRCPPSGNKVTIFHSALLESDDEAGYRRFIGEVVDGTLGSDWGELKDLEDE